ncbi:MAG: metallophosphoesterase [Planctomycetes bacterium]|nr:metallophosphoesterase [Planctomycetota bacterium]
MIAIVSDLHSNIEALEAVLKDIGAHKVDEIYCLGDVIGYGPNPREVLHHARKFKFCLRGNHEDALLFLAADFSMDAAHAIDWTRGRMNAKSNEPAEAQKLKAENHLLWNFVGDLKESHQDDDRIFIHASPRMPTREYVRPPDVKDREKMSAIFEMIPHVCFGGHTHEPGVFTEDFRFLTPAQINHTFTFDAKKYFINVGSVGQPRDGDNRSCYVLLDGNRVVWRRIPYDFRKTMAKIEATKELAKRFASRLKDGR